jgi:hypothetical protein
VDVNCPADQSVTDGTTCEDGDRCTVESFCKDGICTGEDVKCAGKCGDGIKADVRIDSM